MSRKFIRRLLALLLMGSAAGAYAQQLNYTGKVTPAPQQIISQWAFLPVAAGSFEVIVDKNAHNAVQLGKNLLIERVKSFKVEGAGKSAGAVTVVLGELKDENIQNALNKYKVKLDRSIIPEGNEQGYFIRVVKDGEKDVIIAVGTGHRGTFYAAMTLHQSIGLEDGHFLLQCADINDWPVWRERYFGDYVIPSQEQLINYLARNKVDGYACQYRREWREFKPELSYNKKSTWKQAFAPLKEFNDRYDLFDYMFLINIYAAAPREFPILDITKENDVNDFIKRCGDAAELGFNHIMILADDWTPTQKGDYVCPNKSEKERFGNSVGRAHGYLMKRVYEALKPKYPRLSFAFCPAPYSLYEHDVPGRVSHQKYLMDLAKEMPNDIYVVWTGPDIRSNHVNKEDYDLYVKKYMAGQKSFLWDNSGGPMPVPRWETKLYDGFEKDSDGIIFINTFVFSWPWLTPFALGTNDYLWNPRGYNAVASHQDIVEKLYGKGSYKPVKQYIEVYQAINSGDKNANFKDLENTVKEMKKLKMNTLPIEKGFDKLRAKFTAVVPSLKVKKVKMPPVLDGKLDDTCWADADDFKFTAWEKGKSVNPGSGKVCHDGKNLYLAFRFEHASPLKKPVIDGHDGPVYANSDACEIFLEGEKTGGYGHLSFDHEKNLFDETRVQSLGLAWNPDWDVAVDKDKGVWIAEVKIPFRSMVPVIETPVGKGTIWRANFCRSYASEGELSCWSPTYGNSFHTTEFFGRLIFE